VESLVFIFDKIGILAFAFVGVSHGVKKKLDIFGLLLVGVVNAIGGGILRDLLLSKTPYTITHIEYMLFAFGASVFAIALFYHDKRINGKILFSADTLGLSAFAVSGALVSISAGLNIFVTFLLAAITATGGGLIRDIILNEIPFILKRDVYATAAGVGGILMQAVLFIGIKLPLAIFLGLFFVIIVRSYTFYKKVHLPIINNGKK
jgi:uncharacterized membrane protein YeiH